MTKQKKRKKQELSVWGIERDAIAWVQKHTEDLLAPLRDMGCIDYFEARQFAKKAYRAGFADAMLRMGVWPIERDARSFKEKEGESMKVEITNEEFAKRLNEQRSKNWKFAKLLNEQRSKNWKFAKLLNEQRSKNWKFAKLLEQYGGFLGLNGILQEKALSLMSLERMVDPVSGGTKFYEND